MLSIPNKIKEFRKGQLTVKIYPSLEQMGKAAMLDVSDKICELLEEKAEINMIFAAAPSQHEFLSQLILNEKIDWNRINAFHMDEYTGVHTEAPQSFGNFLRQHIFDRVPFKTVNYIDGCAGNLEEECERYSKLLEQYPADIVCLGIGENGHIAFNDPGVADFNDPRRAKIVALDPVCRQQQVNEKCFASLELVPAKAITLTIPALLKADRMYCIVPFSNKANAVYKTVCGEISEECPASILRKKENACLYLELLSAKLININAI